MIGNSFPEYVFIRACIVALRLVMPASIVYLAVTLYTHSSLFSPALTLLATFEICFYLLYYIPRTKRLQTPPAYTPPPMTKSERESLFLKCSADIYKTVCGENMYPRGWFLPTGKGVHKIQRQDVTVWLLWALFSCPPEELQEEWKNELDVYVKTVERLLGEHLIDEGKPSAWQSIRLTLDPVQTIHRPLIWYFIVCLVDTLTSFTLFYRGFKHYSSKRTWFVTFPPRPLLSLLSMNSEPSHDIILPHWYRTHKSTTKLPIVFIHGIGIGLHPYLPFIRDLISRDPDVGILLIELLPISMHITAHSVFPAPLIASTLNNILDTFGISRVVIAAHSYGTFVTSSILNELHTSHSLPAAYHPLLFKIAHVLLIDPIPILLHLPPVAYNFLHRAPSSAAEWQLWYFASTDPDIARTLGRAFFWTEGVTWKEDIRLWMRAEDPQTDESQGQILRRRNIAVVLAGADQIVPAEIVRRYLTGEEEPSPEWIGKAWVDWRDDEPNGETLTRSQAPGGDLEVLFYPGLDHATVFDKPERWGPMLDILERFTHDV